jgi:hypothetical protein
VYAGGRAGVTGAARGYTASKVFVWSEFVGKFAGTTFQQRSGQSRRMQDAAAARGSLWASRPVTSHTNEGLQGARPDSQQCPLGPHPSATLSCRRLAGIRPSARHLPLLSRSVACQKSAYPGRESAHHTNANSARHASAGGIRRQALKHCSPARRGRRTRFVGCLPSVNLNEQSSSRALLWLAVTVAASISAGVVAGPLSRRERAARIWKLRLGPCLSGMRVWKEHPGVGTLTTAFCVRCNSREATNTRACSARHTADGLSCSAGRLLTTRSTLC